MGRLGRRSFGPMAAGLADAGVPPEMLWVIQGMGVFALECLVAVAYVLAVRLDRSTSRSLRAVAWLALVAAVSFHVSAEVVLNLRIGWFSYYMIALACVFFLPASVLYGLGALVYKPAAWLAKRGQDLVHRPDCRTRGRRCLPSWEWLESSPASVDRSISPARSSQDLSPQPRWWWRALECWLSGVASRSSDIPSRQVSPVR